MARAIAAFVLSVGFATTSLGAQASDWVVPRTVDGKPDLQGNWSNETQTPLERMGKLGPTLTEEQAAALENRAQLVEEFRDRPSDPNAPPPSKGGDGAL